MYKGKRRGLPDERCDVMLTRKGEGKSNKGREGEERSWNPS